MITETQRQARKGLVGSSDAAAICGVDPYRSAYDVWATMTGRVPAFAGNKATEAGTFMERGIVDWLEKTLDKPITRDVMVAHDDGVRGTNLDGLIQAGPLTIVEAKTCAIFYPSATRDMYGDEEEGIEGVPVHVVIQTHHQAGVIEATYGRPERIIVAAAIGFRGFLRYAYEPDARLVEVVAEKVSTFFDKFVKTDTPPDDWPTTDVAKALPRIAGKAVEVGDDVMAEYVRLRAEAKSAADAYEAAKGRVIAALGDAEVGKAAAGTVTYKTITKAEYTVKPSSYRQLNFKAAR